MNRMTKILLSLIALSFVLTACGAPVVEETEATNTPIYLEPLNPGTDDEGRYYEVDGGFSYIPPQGWAFVEVDGINYLALAETEQKGTILNNLIFTDEDYSGSLENYFNASLETLQQAWSDYEILQRDQIDLLSGEQVYVVSAKNIVEGVEMLQTQFFFDMGSKKLVLTYTSNLDEDPENIQAVSDFVESLRFD